MNEARYTSTAVLLHWLVALLVLVLIGLGWYMVGIPRGTPERAAFYNLHKSIGVVAGLLIALRIGWRWRHAPPALPASLAQWEIRFAAWSHRLLYACMVVMPLSGYVATNFTKFGVQFFGLVDLKPWAWPDKAIHGVLNDIHVFTSYLFAALVALHVTAALRHLLRGGADIFRRMLPGGARS